MHFAQTLVRTALVATLWAIALPVTAHAAKPTSTADDRPGPGPVTEASAHYDLEQLYGNAQIKEGLAKAREQLAANPSDPALYRHVIRFLFEIGELVHREDTSMDKEALYQEMLDLCNKALELDPGNAHTLFNRGIATGRLATTHGVLASLGNLKSIEQDWLAAANAPYKYESLAGAEHLPCDTYLTLGIFYRVVPDYWIVQLLAGTRGDIDKSIAWLEKSNACQADRIRTLKELGVSRLCAGTRNKDPVRTATGKQVLSYLQTLPKSHTHSELDKAHAQMLIEDPSLACEYSRDGQQDLDEKNIKH
ncbi:MAG: tetratricopeptide (TPR) repeat protein [Kiritimatiellia bacterium]